MANERYYEYLSENDTLCDVLNIILEFFGFDKTKYFVGEVSGDLNKFSIFHFDNDDEFIDIKYCLDKNRKSYYQISTKIVINKVASSLELEQVNQLKNYIDNINFKCGVFENRLEKYDISFNESFSLFGDFDKVIKKDEFNTFDDDILEDSYLKVEKEILTNIEEALSHEHLRILCLNVLLIDFCKKKYRINLTMDDFFFLYKYYKDSIYLMIENKYGMALKLQYLESFKDELKFNENGFLDEDFKDLIKINKKI